MKSSGMIPYDGSATQIYVLDIPLASMPTAVSTFGAFVSELSVPTIDHNAIDPPRTLDEQVIAELATAGSENTQHQLRGRHRGCQDVSLYIWTDVEAMTFDAEVAFWADQVFPAPDETEECVNALSEYVELAEKLRAPKSDCVFSAHETGNPRDEREKPWTFWW